MNILIDECIDRRLAKQLSGHIVKTVPQMGWASVKDGELLRFAENDFDVLITVDRNLPFQQNLAVLDLAVLVLQAPSNRLADLQVLITKILAIVDTAPKGAATAADLRTFFEGKREQSATVAAWSDSTYKKVISSTVQVLVNAGLLQPTSQRGNYEIRSIPIVFMSKKLL